MKLHEFLETVVTTPAGWFLLATRGEDGWREHWYDWGARDTGEMQRIVDDAGAFVGREYDVYFTAHLFGEKRSVKAAVLPSRTVQADLDYAAVMAMPVIPTVLVNTSPGRHQGYWLLNELHQAQEIEDISRRIAYGTRDCDRTGWPAGHRMRLPNTLNFKYMTPAQIEVVGHTIKALDPEAFHLFPELQVSVEQAELDTAWINQGHTPLESPPKQLMHDAGFNTKIIADYDKVVKDRSKYLWGLMQEGFRKGLSRDVVYGLAWGSANNKFKEDRRYAAVADLRKDVLRAEAVATDRGLDIKANLMDLRMQKGQGVILRRLEMSRIVIARMREDGELIHTRGGQLWFMRRDTGRPVELTEHSLWFDAYLQRTFALNQTEIDTRFVKSEIINTTRNQAPSAELSTLSYWDSHTRTLLLHTGGRDVLHVRASSIEAHPNGYAHTVFHVGEHTEPFKLGKIEDLRGCTWYDYLFASQFDYLDGSLTREEAVVLMRAYFLFVLFRSHITNRPLLALFGPPGSGKSTTSKKLYRLLYGRIKKISSLTTPDDYNTATINYPFVAFDGVDTYERWLPELLSQTAAVVDVIKRRLYTDADFIVQSRQALVMLTSHNPKFTREDVVDRLVILQLKRRPWGEETAILEEVSDLRNALWADIVRDVQNVLREPMPSQQDAPQFRIQDFSHYGLWFSRAAGLEAPFVRAIDKLVHTQHGVNMETDQLLISTINRWLKARIDKGRQPEFMQQVTLWSEWMLYATDAHTFERMYRNANVLGRKLVTLHETLNALFDVRVEYKATTGSRQWLIAPKGQGQSQSQSQGEEQSGNADDD